MSDECVIRLRSKDPARAWEPAEYLSTDDQQVPSIAGPEGGLLPDGPMMVDKVTTCPDDLLIFGNDFIAQEYLDGPCYYLGNHRLRWSKQADIVPLADALADLEGPARYAGMRAAYAELAPKEQAALGRVEMRVTLGTWFMPSGHSDRVRRNWVFEASGWRKSCPAAGVIKGDGVWHWSAFIPWGTYGVTDTEDTPDDATKEATNAIYSMLDEGQ